VGPDGIDRGYEGKYVKDVRFLGALKRTPGYVEEAYAALKASLGVDLKGRADFVLRFQDTGANRQGGLRGKANTFSRAGKPAVEILFYSEYLVLDEEEYRQRLAHEIKHAGFRTLMGQAYLNLPKWVREGLAVYGAGQLGDRMSHILSGEVFSGRDPVAVLDGIDDLNHDNSDYLEDSLAFEWLESRKMGNVKAFCRRLVSGENPGKVFADLAGLPVKESMEEAGAHCLSRAEAALGEGYRSFLVLRKSNIDASRSGMASLKRWLAREGDGSYEGWLSSHRGHLLEPNARYRLGKALVIVGKYDQGRRWLSQVLGEDNRRSSIGDDAAYWIGLSFEREGREDKAREAFGAFLRDYSWANQVKKIKGHEPAGPVLEGR
jgi:tetratricopeptide (TPR) repeat protein